jgi:hypothetical protein
MQPEEHAGMHVAQDERPIAANMLYQHRSHKGGQGGQSMQGSQQEGPHVRRHCSLCSQQWHQGSCECHVT